MADISVTAAQVAAAFPDKAEIYDFVAGAAITAGQAVYVNSSGLVAAAVADTSSTAQFKGIALNAAGTSGAVSVLKKGHVYGFTLTSLSYGDPVFLTDTAGVLGDTNGTVTCGVGQVVPLSDSSKTKVLYIEADWVDVYA